MMQVELTDDCSVIFKIKQMIINNSSYANSIKQKNYNRDYLKKKKSQQAFYIKAKINSQLGQQFKSLQSRKSQARVSTSMCEINPKEDPKRVGSLEMPSTQLTVLENMLPTKASINKQKKNIGHCWSERNMTLINDQSKLQKYRKFSSNAELGEEPLHLESQRRKLSLVESPHESVPTKKIEKLGIMAWLILIRKLFVDEFKKRSSKCVKLNILYSYIQKLDSEGLNQFSLIIEPLEYEVELSKAQMTTVLETYFASCKKTKPAKTQNTGKATFCEIMNCLIQFQSKNNNLPKQNHKSTSSEQEAVETARFQEGGAEELKKRKLSQKKNQLNSLVPKMQTHKYIKQNGKENIIASVNTGGQNLFKSPSACNKSKQSLNPSQSPFTITDSRSIENSRLLLERDESGPLVFKKGGLEKQAHEGLLGMLTIEGKSPRELMVSEIYESIQKEGFVHQNNVSFSLEHLEIDNHLSFEHTVHSFEEILRKIQNIQNNYKSKMDNQILEQSKIDKNEEEVNLFLQQLINYRIASSNEPFEEESYSYLVSFENLTEFKEHNKGIMVALLQSTYLKQYFNALQGIKMKNCLPFLKNISHLLHSNIKIMNISHNNLSNINFIIDAFSNENSLQFLNINHNFFADITPIIKKCTKLKELHCHANLILQIKQCNPSSRELKIIDLSSNKIEQEKDLSGLVGMTSLIIINILNNPLSQGNWKNEWSGSININNIYMMDNLYVMSSYGHQKDITFTIDKHTPKNQKDRYKSIDLIHQFSISDINRANQYKFGKQTPKTDSMLNSSKSSSKPHEPPKQKISKIKAFIDGKVI